MPIFFVQNFFLPNLNLAIGKTPRKATIIHKIRLPPARHIHLTNRLPKGTRFQHICPRATKIGSRPTGPRKVFAQRILTALVNDKANRSSGKARHKPARTALRFNSEARCMVTDHRAQLTQKKRRGSWASGNFALRFDHICH